MQRSDRQRYAYPAPSALSGRVARLVMLVVPIAAMTMAIPGCAGSQAFREGNAHVERGETADGLKRLKQAADESPSNEQYRRAYFEQRERALNGALRDMELALDVGDFKRADLAAARARELDPLHARVVSSADRIDNARRLYGMLERADRVAREGKVDDAIATVRQVLTENAQHRPAQAMLRRLQRQQADRPGNDLGLYPKLKEAFRKPVSLTLAGATLLQTFEALKQASGMNFVFDRDIRTDQRVTLSVSGKTVEDVLRLILATNQLERRVLDDDTLLIYPNLPQKVRDYQELVVRSFYLTNADINKAASLVRSIARARDVFLDEKLNLLVVRDTLEVVRLAERLLANQDLADPEVVLELEVMEVSSNRLLEVGIRWPDSVSASVQGAAGVPGRLTLPEFRAADSSLVRLQFNDPLIAAQLRSQKGDANLLANPRIRVRNRQTAKILIGERVPVITTSAAANVGTFESVSYLDVGLKLELEPTVSLDDEVAMKIALEVSNILETVIRSSGTQTYRLGTRNASTQLRVRDGETQILAGLIQRDERKANTGVPLMNEIPVLGRLFGVGSDNNVRTEIVLLITPRIVRAIDVPGPGQIEFLSGTEGTGGAAPIQQGPSPGASLTVPGPRPPPAPATPTPAPAEPAPAAPATPAGGLTPPPMVPSSPTRPGAFP